MKDMEPKDVLRSIEWLQSPGGDIEWNSAGWLEDGVYLEGRNRRTGQIIDATFTLTDFGAMEDD